MASIRSRKTIEHTCFLAVQKAWCKPQMKRENGCDFFKIISNKSLMMDSWFLQITGILFFWQYYIPNISLYKNAVIDIFAIFEWHFLVKHFGWNSVGYAWVQKKVQDIIITDDSSVNFYNKIVQKKNFPRKISKITVNTYHSLNYWLT